MYLHLGLYFRCRSFEHVLVAPLPVDLDTVSEGYELGTGRVALEDGNSPALLEVVAGHLRETGL